MKSGQQQRRVKGFTPTRAQELVRNRTLRIFNAPFGTVRRMRYCGATWAGTIVTDTFYGDLLEVSAGASVRQKIGDKARERRAASYHGIYTALAHELEGLEIGE